MSAHDPFAFLALVSTLAKIGRRLRGIACGACLVVLSWAFVCASSCNGACLLAGDTEYILTMAAKIIDALLVEGFLRIS